MRRLVLAILLLLVMPTLAGAADSYAVANGASVEITEHDECRMVTNNDALGRIVFVPTKTAGEWSSFYGATIPDVSIDACEDGSCAYTWTDRTAATSTTWTAIAGSPSGAYLAAAGTNGAIYVSSDSGATWTQRTGLSATNRVIYGLTISADGTKLAAATYTVSGSSYTPGYIFTSTNNGASWTQRTAAGQRIWSGLVASSDGNRLAATSAFAGIFLSTDGGANWSENTSLGTDKQWGGLTMSSDGMTIAAAAIGDIDDEVSGCFIFGDEYVYTSTNGGASWTKRTGAASPTWIALGASADGTKLAGVSLGGNSCDPDFNMGYIYTSSDSGATWIRRTGAGLREWYGLKFSGDGSKLFATDYSPGNAGLFISNDNGATWIQEPNAGNRIWYYMTVSEDGSKIALPVVQNAGVPPVPYIQTGVGSCSGTGEAICTGPGGYCWHAGAIGQSCEATCASYGGTTEGAITYAGSGGSLANCQAVVESLGLTWNQTPSDNANATLNALGCIYVEVSVPPTLYKIVQRATGAATTQAASYAQARRICSCVAPGDGSEDGDDDEDDGNGGVIVSNVSSGQPFPSSSGSVSVNFGIGNIEIPYPGGTVVLMGFSASGAAYYFAGTGFQDMETYWSIQFQGDVRGILNSHRLMIRDVTLDLTHDYSFPGYGLSGGNAYSMVAGYDRIDYGTGTLLPPLFSNHTYEIWLEPF